MDGLLERSDIGDICAAQTDIVQLSVAEFRQEFAGFAGFFPFYNGVEDIGERVHYVQDGSCSERRMNVSCGCHVRSPL